MTQVPKYPNWKGSVNDFCYFREGPDVSKFCNHMCRVTKELELLCLRRSRKENLARAIEHESNGNRAAAYECYQKAVDITPSMAHELIQV